MRYTLFVFHCNRFLCSALIGSIAIASSGQIVLERGVFVEKVKNTPEKRIPVVKVKSPEGGRKIIVYRTKLRVNTDGSPLSYHPFDPTGKIKAINNVINGVKISYRDRPADVPYSEQLAAFKSWRDGNWRPVPPYRFVFQNVIAAKLSANRDYKVPRTFESGPFNGYFISLTSLKNRVPKGDFGPQVAENQVDCVLVPGLVLPKGNNVVRRYGARVGDILVAFNPANKVTVCAVINDEGPPNKLGEGSVALNMRLKAVSRRPTNYGEAKKLDTGSQQIFIAIFPGSSGYSPARPFSAANIATRVDNLVRESGFNSVSELVQSLVPLVGHTPVR